MRAVVVFLLVGILSACPLLCRAAEAGCCLDRDQEDGRGIPDIPASCSDDGVSCITAGAIQADQLSLPVPDAVGHPALDLWSLDPLYLAPRAQGHAVHALPSPASPGDAGTLRALLQNFRC